MQNPAILFTYKVRHVKWWIFGKPATLILSPTHIQLKDKEDKEIFSCDISDLKYANYDMEYGSWKFETKDIRKAKIQTHGIFSFANWRIRKTNVNEKLREFLDANNVASTWYEPIIESKK